MTEEKLSESIIGAAIEVHRALGPGLLESVYEECLCHELKLRGIPFERQIPLPVRYKGATMDCGYRLDVLVDGKIVVELKTVDQVLPIHKAQILTYMRLTSCSVGLILNFNVPVLKDGITRMAL
ncbi:MAG: GxxExxY protein [Candidatus Sumerlaeia bacterium]